MSHQQKKRKALPAKKQERPSTADTAASGNTKEAATLSEVRHKGWFLTENNPRTNLEGLYDTVTKIDAMKCDYVIQLEIGAEEKVPHLQGCVWFESARTMPQMKLISERAHWEVANNKKACINYCSKIETATGEIWHRGLALPPKDPLSKYDLRPWQMKTKWILKEEPDDRTIHWFWDREGASGKTLLQKHLVITQDALVLSGKATDIKYAISKRVNEDCKPVTIILLNYSRSNEDFVSYEAIEQVKDGLFFSGKYESQMCVYDCPHVICFANFAPQQDKLSLDRWDVKEINDVTYDFV